jgi:hypothetical protein
VTNIGSYAFYGSALTNIAIPYGVTTIGDSVFLSCSGLTGVTIPDGVISIMNQAFGYCSSLTNITLPSSVTNIGTYAFASCSGLAGITIGTNVTSIGHGAFQSCTSLIRICFQGNAPGSGSDSTVFSGDTNATVYYLPGGIGWKATFDNRPAFLWNAQPQTGDSSFRMQANQFGFNLAGSSNLVIVVEAATNMANAVWSPIATNTLNTFVGTNGTSYFSDPQWTNYPDRFYRLRSP